MSKLVTLCLLLPLTSLVTGQPTCTELSVYNYDYEAIAEPISGKNKSERWLYIVADTGTCVGSSLPVCATPELQCCTVGYIHDKREALRQAMIIHLAEQLDDNQFFLKNITETIRNCKDNQLSHFIPNLSLSFQISKQTLCRHSSNRYQAEM